MPQHRQARVPGGVPTGGEFSESAHSEPALHFSGGPLPPDAGALDTPSLLSNALVQGRLDRRWRYVAHTIGERPSIAVFGAPDRLAFDPTPTPSIFRNLSETMRSTLGATRTLARTESDAASDAQFIRQLRMNKAHRIIANIRTR